MRPLRALLIGSVLATSVPALASAATAPTDDFVRGGPALSGENAAWLQGGNEKPFTVHLATPEGRASTVFTLPPTPGTQHFLHSFAASSSRLALLRRTGDCGPGGCYGRSLEIFLGTPGGNFERFGPEHDIRGGGDCPPLALDLQGEEMAVTAGNCPERAVTIHNLGTGTSETIPWAREDLSLDYDAQVKLAGRFVAWHARGQGRDVSGAGRRSVVIVWDRVAQREAYRVDLFPLMGDLAAPSNYEQTFDLQDDGTILASAVDYRQPGREPVLAWASVAEPRLHPVPVRRGTLTAALHGNLIALRRRDYNDFAVVDLSGNPVNVFDYDRRGWGDGFDFDGKRLTWAQGDGVHNEPYPVVPTVDGPEAPVSDKGTARLPLWCPTTDEACQGSLTLVTPSAETAAARVSRSRKVGSRRYRVPARRTQRLSVRLTARARATLRRRGRLTVRATVVNSRARPGQRPSRARVVLRRR